MYDHQPIAIIDPTVQPGDAYLHDTQLVGVYQLTPVYCITITIVETFAVEYGGTYFVAMASTLFSIS